MIVHCGIGTIIDGFIGPYKRNRRIKWFCVNREHDKATFGDNAKFGIAKQS